MTQDELFKVLVAHCKEYGFIFPSSEIYDGLAAVYDYGQMGVQLKNNIKNYWWEAMTRLNENIVGIDSAIFMHPRIWEASGHVSAFNDPLIDNKDSKKRYRADVLIEDYLGKIEEKINKEVEKGRKKLIDTLQREETIGYVSGLPLVLAYPLTGICYDKAGKGIADETPLRDLREDGAYRSGPRP